MRVVVPIYRLKMLYIIPSTLIHLSFRQTFKSSIQLKILCNQYNHQELERKKEL